MHRKPDIEARFNISWETTTENETTADFDFLTKVFYDSFKMESRQDSELVDGKYHNKWSFAVSETETDYLEKVMEDAIIYCEKYGEFLVQWKKAKSADYLLEVAMTFSGKVAPTLVISDRIISFLNKVDGWMHIDTYSRS